MSNKVWHKGEPPKVGRYWVCSQLPGEKPCYRADEWKGSNWLLVDSKNVLYWAEIVPVEGNCDE